MKSEFLSKLFFERVHSSYLLQGVSVIRGFRIDPELGSTGRNRNQVNLLETCPKGLFNPILGP